MSYCPHQPIDHQRLLPSGGFSDKNTDMSEIHQARAKELFKTMTEHTPDPERFYPVLTSTAFASIKLNGLEPAAGMEEGDTTIYDDVYTFPGFVYMHPVVAAAVIKFLASNDNTRPSNLFTNIIKAATTTNPNDPNISTAIGFRRHYTLCGS
jgi:hypothetical protein